MSGHTSNFITHLVAISATILRGVKVVEEVKKRIQLEKKVRGCGEDSGDERRGKNERRKRIERRKRRK